MKRLLLKLGLAMTLGAGSANAAVTISGAVKDTSGKALDSVRISLSIPGGGTFARDTTGTDGLFSIVSDTTKGKVVLKSTSMGSVGYTTKYDTIELSGLDTSGIAIRMVPVPPTVKSTMSGKVDSAGSAKLVSGAVVTLRGTGAGATTLRDTTGEDGTYSFPDLTTGAYTLSVSATGYTTRNVTDTVKADPKVLDVSLVAIVVSSIGGKVDSAGSAKPLQGVIVTLRGMGNGANALRDTTGEDGKYSFTGLATGTYTLSFSATGYTTKNVTDTVKADPKVLDVSLVAVVPAKTIRISGTITDSTGKKMDSVYVAQRSTGTGATTISRDTTGADGAYEITTTSISGKFVLRLIDLRSPTDTLVDSISLDSADLKKDIVWKKVRSSGVEIRHAARMRSIAFERGSLILSGMVLSGVAKVFDPRGELMLEQAFQGGDRVELRLGTKLAKGSYFVSVTQGTSRRAEKLLIK